MLRMLQVKLELLVGLRGIANCESDTFRLNTSSGIRAWGEECESQCACARLHRDRHD